MNDKQFAFIICTDNDQYYQECTRYIQELVIPQGYTIDIITITDTVSISEAYNAGMEASNATYKIYMHQSTFILNQTFLTEILNIFKNPKIGMIGMTGTNNLQITTAGNMTFDVGNTFYFDGRRVDQLYNHINDDIYIKAKAIDNFCIITQYDIPWKQPYKNDCTYYSIIHSLDMARAGYDVVCPIQEIPWCYNDCGSSVLNISIADLRGIFQNYDEIMLPDKINTPDLYESIPDIRRTLINGIQNHLYDALENAVEDIRLQNLPDDELSAITNLLEIYSLEHNCTDCKHSFIFDEADWTTIYSFYTEIRFILLRIYTGRVDDRIAWIREAIENEALSKDLVSKLAAIIVPDTDVIYKELIRKYMEQPLVSVIIPVYNAESFITDTIQSILNQSYKNLELIIVDDASTDNSRQIISSFDDDRIKVIFRERNGNVCISCNDALKQVSGKYIFMSGHDDIFKPLKIERQVAFMEAHPTYVTCFSWTDIIDETYTITNTDDENCKKLYDMFCCQNRSRNKWIFRLIHKGNTLCGSSVCIRVTDASLHELYYNTALLQTQDYELWLRLLLVVGSTYVMQDKLVLYRRFKTKSNLSKATKQNIDLGFNELNMIVYIYIWSLSDYMYKQIFSDYMRYPNTNDSDYILCEKAILLANSKNQYVKPEFMKLFRNEKIRNILEEKYNFTPNDFYNFNASENK
ncbi:MAG: glycosyltransferase [Clostridium sp.]|nr:glycosyltransferase [Clostridium sp.]